MILDNKITIITGAARGIGKEIALQFAKQGSHLVLSDIDSDGIEDVAQEIKGQNRQALTVATDVSKQSDAENLINSAIEKFGRIDILINNAGITRDTLLIRMKEEQWDSVIAVNLKGTFNCIKAVARPMMKQRAGRIINISSVVGVMGNAGQSNYSASKAGVIGLTKSIAKELAERNILVNAVAPGYIETEMTKNLPDSAIKSFIDIIPLKKSGKPKDVANVCLFLAGELSSYVTGQVIHVDGGMVM